MLKKNAVMDEEIANEYKEQFGELLICNDKKHDHDIDRYMSEMVNNR
jgi:hypothetical protein